MQQWTEIRRSVLVDGLSKRAACRRFGIHWDTLQKMLEHPSPPGYRRVAKVDRPVIGPWLGRLEKLLEERKGQPRKQQYTVKRMWEILCGEGFEGGYTTVKDAVRELRQSARKEVFMPLVQRPGEAQVDFGHAVARMNGMLRKIVFFVMSLVHSDAMFVMAFPRECTEAFLEAHLAAFAFFGFVPGRIRYDNTKTAVAQILGPHERKLTTAFSRLVSHALFEPVFCRVRRANEKGVVEGAVRYSRQTFLVPVPDVADFAELNVHLGGCCKSDLGRRLRGKTLRKRPLLVEDRLAGLPLHYLPRLDRKPGSLDGARPLEHWPLPEAFATLRRRLEATREDGGRDYIRVLMLLREYRLEHVTMALQHALRWGAPTADAIKQLLIPDERPEQRTFRLDGREPLAGVKVAATDLSAYATLREVRHG